MKVETFQTQSVKHVDVEEETKPRSKSVLVLLTTLLLVSGLIGAYVYMNTNTEQQQHQLEVARHCVKESEVLFNCPIGTGRRGGAGPCIPYYEWVGGLNRYKTCASVCGLRGKSNGGLVSGTYTRSRKPFYICRGRSTGCGNDYRMGWNLYGYNTCRSPCGNGVVQTHNQCLCNNNIVPNTFRWVTGNGQSCGAVCGRMRGYHAISSGKYRNGHRFYACRANGGNEGLRGGWNLIFGGYGTKCTVAWGNRQQLHSSYQCLCARTPLSRGKDKFTVFGVNRAHNIFSLYNRVWRRIPGAARYASVGFDGTIWVINRYDHIYRTTHNRVLSFIKRGVAGLRGAPIWLRVPGALVDVSVNNRDDIWGVNRQQYIYNWNGIRWRQVAGRLIDVSVGADKSVLGVNRYHYIFHMTGNLAHPRWRVIPGRLKQIDHANANLIVGVNKFNYIYGKRCPYLRCRWRRFPGRARYSSIDLEGTVMVINSLDYIFFGRFNKLMAGVNDWHVFPGRLISGEVRESFQVRFKNFGLKDPNQNNDNKEEENTKEEQLAVDKAKMPELNLDEEFNKMPQPTEEQELMAME